MTKNDQAMLKTACQNRGLSIRYSDTSVEINGIVFNRLSDAEEYLMGINRIDM